MPVTQRPWYPWASAAAWALLVFALVFVNSGGNLLLALAVGAFVGELSRRLALARSGSPEQ